MYIYIYICIHPILLGAHPLTRAPFAILLPPLQVIQDAMASDDVVAAWDFITLILGLYRDNGKENGNYYSILGHIGVILG